jgi:hypothetical protein
VHGPFTTGPLLCKIVHWTDGAKSRYLPPRVVLILCVEGPCGDSARCEASAGIDGVVCGADISYFIVLICQRYVYV